MIELTKDRCEAQERMALLQPASRFDLVPLQLGLGGSPWRVAIASMLLSRARRPQAQRVLMDLLSRWPTAKFLAIASIADVELVVRPCGFQRARARVLVRFSEVYTSGEYRRLQDISGVGPYVADAVGLFCFGCTELESSDGVLHAHATGRYST